MSRMPSTWPGRQRERRGRGQAGDEIVERAARPTRLYHQDVSHGIFRASPEAIQRTWPGKTEVRRRCACRRQYLLRCCSRDKLRLDKTSTRVAHAKKSLQEQLRTRKIE
jgi:hypothetical protein